MSKDPENKSIETPTSGESHPSTEDITSNKTEVAAAQSPTAVASDEIMARIVDLCDRNAEVTAKLNERLNTLAEKLGIIKEDVDKSKPLHVQAKVTGVYNFEERKKEIVDEYQMADRNRARNLFKMVRNKYPNG